MSYQPSGIDIYGSLVVAVVFSIFISYVIANGMDSKRMDEHWDHAEIEVVTESPCGNPVGVWTTDGDENELVVHVCPKGVRP